MLVLNGYFGELPDAEELQSIQNPEASIVFDRNEELLGKYYLQDRTPVAFSDLNPFLIHALIATEDRRFYEHHGIDLRSLLRVAIKSVLFQSRASGGGSTLSQQLAKNLFPRSEYTFLYYPVNKTKEFITAYRLENIYSKDQLLELYLNTVSFGSDVYGIQSAAQRYFSKRASELSAVESATLVGMLKATTSYNPILNPKASLNRRNMVFQQMRVAGYINDSALDSLEKQPLMTYYQPATFKSSSYFLAQIRKKLDAFINEYNRTHDQSLNINTSGLRIYTTLDKNLQKLAEKAVLNNMKKLQNTFDNHWKGDLWKTKASLFKREFNDVKHGRTSDQLSEKTKQYVFTYNGPLKKTWTVADSLKYYLSRLQAGFVAMEPGSGAIRTWVGGIGYRYFPYDHVSVQAKRQVGSVFKPIVFAAALEQGVSPCTYYKAKQVSYSVKEGKWKPSNSEEEYEGKYSMQGGLAASVNTVAVKVLEDAGLDNAVKLARAMGISSELPRVPSIALGTPSISLIEMVTAYSCFANNGRRIRPHTIERIEDHNGKVLYKYKDTSGGQVISSESARVMIHLLQAVVDEGTGRSLRTKYKLKNDLGGKTGTTQSNADGWFISVSPNLVTGAWVGGIYPSISFRDTRLGQGATMALPIIGEFYREMNRERRFARYTKPKFPALPDHLRKELDCDPFKENFKWIKNAFSSKDKNERKSKEKEGLLKKIGKLFKRKQP